MDTQGGKNRNIEATSSSEVGTHFLDIVPGDLNYCYWVQVALGYRAISISEGRIKAVKYDQVVFYRVDEGIRSRNMQCNRSRSNEHLVEIYAKT